MTEYSKNRGAYTRNNQCHCQYYASDEHIQDLKNMIDNYKYELDKLKDENEELRHNLIDIKDFEEKNK